MYGAVVGDIVGSRFEFNNHKSKEFELFTEECKVTDDSIMTLAVGKAIMEYKGGATGEASLGELAVKYMQEIGRKYPHCGYGEKFFRWLCKEESEPYGSYGNGSAMRVSSAGFAAQTEEEALELARAVTEVTHNHPEGLKGAEAVTVAIFMARQGALKSEIRKRMSRYYNLNYRIDRIRKSYKFNETCQGSVPQAIMAFLEGDSFEDVIRTAVSIGGDSDTIAAIAGSIAEAYYGVPDDMWEKAKEYLDTDLSNISYDWSIFTWHAGGRFDQLTKYIKWFEQDVSFGEWVVDTKNDGSAEHPKHLPWVRYTALACSFIDDFYAFSFSYPEYEVENYNSILEDNDENTENINTPQIALAWILWLIRHDRFCEGALLEAFRSGHILKCLKRLEKTNADDIERHK